MPSHSERALPDLLAHHRIAQGIDQVVVPLVDGEILLAVIRPQLFQQFAIGARDVQLAGKHHFPHFLQARFYPVVGRAVVDGVLRHHVGAVALELHSQAEAAALVVHVAVVRPGDRDAQPAGHAVDSRNVIERGRLLHHERIDHP